MKNLNQQMEKSRIQKEKIENLLKSQTITSSSGAGLVEITVNGLNEVKNVNIDETIISKENKGMIETLIASAFNEAVLKVEKLKETELMKSFREIMSGEGA